MTAPSEKEFLRQYYKEFSTAQFIGEFQYLLENAGAMVVETIKAIKNPLKAKGIKGV